MFADKLDHLERLPQGPEKESAAKAASVELAGLAISVLTKEELRDRFGKVTST